MYSNVLVGLNVDHVLRACTGVCVYFGVGEWVSLCFLNSQVPCAPMRWSLSDIEARNSISVETPISSATVRLSSMFSPVKQNWTCWCQKTALIMLVHSHWSRWYWNGDNVENRVIKSCFIMGWWWRCRRRWRRWRRRLWRWRQRWLWWWWWWRWRDDGMTGWR